MSELKESKSDRLSAAVNTLKESARIDKLKEIDTMLIEINLKEPEAIDVLYDVISHIAGTYKDKYQGDAKQVVDTKHILTKMQGGKWANIHTALKYLQRYISDGYAKSNNPLDIKKCIHYLVFELTRLVHLPQPEKDHNL